MDLIVTAAVPDRRAPIAVGAMRNGKDVVADKPGCVSFEQLEQVMNAVADTGRFWSVTFSERFEVRCVARAGRTRSRRTDRSGCADPVAGPHTAR